MKKKRMLILAISLFLLAIPKENFCQTLNLGILSSFEGYTGAGGISNGSGATWTGDAGTNLGIISGFGAPPAFTGTTYNANAVTEQCRVDLFRVYIHLNDIFVNYPATHAPAFGGGETLTPGVYSIPGAGSLGGAITLDGGSNPNAFFIIKFYGAMTVGAGAVVNLTGGTKSCNVFWIAEGAISVAANANVKGTLFAKIGAVGLGAGAVLEGRMFSLQGALTTGVGAIVGPPACVSTIPIFCETVCSPAAAVNVLGVLSNFALYTNLGAVANTSTSGIDGNIGVDVGNISGFESSIHVGSFNTADALTAQAKIDIDYAYNSLMALPNTILSHAAVFGIGETITSGVYFINGAGSLGGTLILDAQNDPDAIFVFKFAGAFAVAAQSKIILVNGARRCNVFWIGGAGVSTGAVTIGAGAVLKGTFLSHGGACSSGDGLFLAGRQLSTGGAVNTYAGIVFNNPVCVVSTPLGLPIILAVADTTAAINGLIGGVTAALTINDLLNGTPVVIGTDSGNVVLTGLTVPVGLILNANGTVTVAPNTPAGNLSLTYKICEVTNPTNCSTVTSIIVVSAPIILAVADTTAAVNGTTGGTTSALTLNDKLNGSPVVIGTAPGNVTLTGVTVPSGLTLNPNGTVTIAPNTTPGNYSVTYKICEITNPTNCSTVTSIIVVATPSPSDLTLNITLAPNIMHGATPFNVTVRVSEMLGNPTDGSEIMVRIPKDLRLSFTFNAAATHIGFSTVNNAVWTYDASDQNYFVFRTNTVIASNASSTFGFSGTFTPGQSNGKLTVTASLNSGSGGETNSQNNQDAEVADYFIN